MQRVAFLDHLRIFAFLSVLVGHAFYHPLEALSQDGSLHASVRALAGLVLPFVRYGGAGVVVFFLVSGYIITRVLVSEHPAEFAIKRLFRIYPLYISALLSERVLTLLVGNPIDTKHLIIQLTLFGDISDTPYSLGGVEWTLRIEMVFYLLMGLSKWITQRVGMSMDRIGYRLFGAIVVFLALAPPLTRGDLAWGDWPATGVITLYFPFLLVGSMVQQYEQQKIKPWILAAFIALVLTHFYRSTPVYQPLWKEDHHAFIALVIFLVAWTLRHHLESNRIILWLSDLTYSVYLFHNWLFFIILQELITRTGWSMSLCTFLSLTLLVGVCLLASAVVEKPSIALGRKLVKRFAFR